MNAGFHDDKQVLKYLKGKKLTLWSNFKQLGVFISAYGYNGSVDLSWKDNEILRISSLARLRGIDSRI